MVSIFLGVAVVDGAVVGRVVAPFAGTVVVVAALEPPPSLHATAISASAVTVTTSRRPHLRSGLSSQRAIRGRFGDNANLMGWPGTRDTTRRIPWDQGTWPACRRRVRRRSGDL